MLKKIRCYLEARLFYIWLLFFSALTVFISPESTIHYAIVSTYLVYYLVYAVNRKLFFWLVGFITITLFLYYPVDLRYGSLNSGIVAAFIETNMDESLSFLQQLKISNFFIPLIFVFSAFILFRLEKYNKPTDNKKILHSILFLILLFSILWLPTKLYVKQLDGLEDTAWSLTNTPVNVIAFYTNIYESINSYYNEKNELENLINIPSPWQLSSVQPKYKNYVLIIGESVRRDWVSTYGFHLPTTPFLDQTKGYINSGYISAAPATYHSLLYSLYLKDQKTKKVNYAYNIITLAKAANFKTIWLSNQGSMGKYDTIASRIGASADVHLFTKKGAFNTSYVDDDKLLEMFAAQMNQTATEGNRLFVLHLMGSHAKFCDRVNDKVTIDFVNKSLSCYASSILKTDALIENVVALLKQQQQRYSLIYFSDHGLSYINKEDKNELSLTHGSEFKQNYEVPFFKLSSDDTHRKIVNVQRSAMHFMYGFAQWLGIQAQELNTDYDFFSEKNDTDIKVFNFEKEVPFAELREDKLPVYK
ncbi:sulfatase-like hydrolase/transferase [Lonepinella koalarum]